MKKFEYCEKSEKKMKRLGGKRMIGLVGYKDETKRERYYFLFDLFFEVPKLWEFDTSAFLLFVVRNIWIVVVQK